MNKKYKYYEVKDQVRQQIIGIDDGLQLRAVRVNGTGCQWFMVHVTARGATTTWEVQDLGTPAQVEKDIHRLEIRAKGLRSALLALPSVANRPGDYGTSRSQLENLRRSENILQLVGSIPTGRKIGKAKVSLATASECFQAAQVLNEWPAGRALVLSLTAEPQSSQVVQLRIPADIHHKLKSEATASLMSPGQFVAALLRDRYKSG